MQSEDLERILTMLPRSAVAELDKLATEQGLSRSALIRTVLLRYLKDQAAG